MTRHRDPRKLHGKCQFCQAPIYTDRNFNGDEKLRPIYYMCECRLGGAYPPYSPNVSIKTGQERVRESINSKAPLAETDQSIDVPVEEIRHGRDNSGGNLSKERLTPRSSRIRKGLLPPNKRNK